MSVVPWVLAGVIGLVVAAFVLKALVSLGQGFAKGWRTQGQHIKAQREAECPPTPAKPTDTDADN